MKLAVIAEEERKEDAVPLLKRAEGIFEEALFVPARGIRIEKKEIVKILYKGRNISEFDVVIPMPSPARKDMFLAISVALENSNTVVPYDTETLLVYQRKLAGIRKLREAGLAVQESHYAISETALKDIIPEIVYPVKVTIGTHSSLVEDEKHLKSMTKMKKPGQGIMIEPPAPEKRTACFVVGNEFISAVEIINGKMRSTSVGDGVKNTAISAVQALGALYGYVTMAEGKIISFSLFPPFAELEKVSGNDTSTYMLNALKSKAGETPKKKGVIQDLLKSIGVKKQ